jgi:hypothetical protein
MAPPPIIEEELPIVSVDEGQEDIDFITEQLTEAEVFAKYGLTEKAVEHLQAVLERSPRNFTAFDKLLRIHLDEGNGPEVRAIGERYVALLEETGEVEAAEALRSEIVSRGYSLTGAAAAPAPLAAEEPEVLELTMEPEVEIGGFEAPVPEIEIEAEAPGEAEPEIEFDIEPPQKTVEPEIEFAIDLTEELQAEAAPEPAAEVIDELSADELVLAPEEELPLEALEAEAPAAEIGFGAEVEAPALELELPEPEPAPDLAAEPLPEPLESELAAPFLAPEPEEPAAAAPALEELGEIDFYVEQELWEEAEERLALLEKRFPAHPELTSRRFQLEEARRAAAPAAPESDLLAGIREEVEATTSPAAEVTNLFDEEDDFFDLAAELEQELATEEEPITISEEEQSLEEIFKEFKRGVEQQLDAEDYDTHYNLGIAYKEMGLIDEAIGEFQLAAKDPKRTIECCSMLGLCFLEKGMPQLAIKWYQKGLEAPEISEEEHLGLLYDLGAAFLEVGDTQGAQKAFMEIYGINSNYRDIVNRIKQLEDVAP